MAKNVITIPATISKFTASPLGSRKKRKVAAYARPSSECVNRPAHLRRNKKRGRFLVKTFVKLAEYTVDVYHIRKAEYKHHKGDYRGQIEYYTEESRSGNFSAQKVRYDKTNRKNNEHAHKRMKRRVDEHYFIGRVYFEFFEPVCVVIESDEFPAFESVVLLKSH